MVIPYGLDRRHKWEKGPTRAGRVIFMCRRVCDRVKYLQAMDVLVCELYAPYVSELVHAPSILDLFV